MVFSPVVLVTARCVCIKMKLFVCLSISASVLFHSQMNMLTSNSIVVFCIGDSSNLNHACSLSGKLTLKECVLPLPKYFKYLYLMIRYNWTHIDCF